MQPVPACARELDRARRPVSPGEAARGERKRVGVPLRERLLLVTEHDRGQEVHEAMFAVATDRVMETGGRLEGEVSLAAGAYEARKRGDARRHGAAAANLCMELQSHERIDLVLDGVVKRHLDVDLRRGTDE